jgi:hypothetical protein
MIFTTNKPLNDWGKVLHDEDMAAAILDRVLERGRFIHLDGPSGRTRHLNLEETLPENTKRLRISGIWWLRIPGTHSFGRSVCSIAVKKYFRRPPRRNVTSNRTHISDDIHHIM